MQDHAGRVIYIGKAKNLRARAASYFLKAAAEEDRTRLLVQEVYDIDYLDAESEVDALLMEVPADQGHSAEVQQRTPGRQDRFPICRSRRTKIFRGSKSPANRKSAAVKLYGPFTSAGMLRGAVDVLQRVFKFRTCSLDIDESDDRWQWFRPCLLASIDQCTAPCNLRISKEEYRRVIRRLRMFVEGNARKLLAELQNEMEAAAAEQRYEQAARLRDEIEMLDRLRRTGRSGDSTSSPKSSTWIPRRAWPDCSKCSSSKPPRTIEGVDIAHLGGNETVASLVQFIDGMPFKPGYRRYRIREVVGVDDYASIQEVVARRFQKLSDDGATFRTCS